MWDKVSWKILAISIALVMVVIVSSMPVYSSTEVETDLQYSKTESLNDHERLQPISAFNATTNYTCPLPFINKSLIKSPLNEEITPEQIQTSIMSRKNPGEKNLQSLKFTKPHDISGLNLKGFSVKELEYPAELVKTLDFHVNASECSIHPMFGEYVYVKVGDLKPYTAPGEPQLPMKTLLVKLPKSAEIEEVKAVSGKYREIENKLKIVPMPQPYIWDKQQNAGKFIFNEKVYSMDKYFPGKVLSYDVGCDNDYKYVFVRVYPLQYIPSEEKATLITDLRINVYYSLKTPLSFRATTNLTPQTSSTSTCVIITPSSLASSASTLADFHNGTGITTTIVTTDEIAAKYTPAADPPYPGYKGTHPGKGNITNYDYTLAKKIVSYLKDDTAHPNLKYVTLLGNAKLVPPSYYYFDEAYYNSDQTDFYNSWIPTDFFYASPDYDLVTNYKIGRIPVNDLTQATSVVNKIENWYGGVDYSWFKNVAIAGGRPFSTEYFIGEMITTDVVNRGYLDGMDVEKCFRTDNRFNNVTFKNALANTGFVYHIGHGSGDSWSLEGSPLDVNALENLPANSKIPIVVSVACMNGAYDTNLMPNPDAKNKLLSVGEAILLSNGGGIAYIGGSRVNSGGPLFTLDFGYITISKETTMVGILTNVFRAYHDGNHILGDLTANATDTFVSENDLEQADNKRALFEFVLLGDPALKIPVQQSSVSYSQPTLMPKDPLKYYVSYGYRPLNLPGQATTIISTTDSPQVDIKIVEITSPFSENVLTTQKTPVNNRVSFDYTPKELQYSIRVSSADGKEGWLHSTTAYPIVFSRNVEIPLDGETITLPALFLTTPGSYYVPTGTLGEFAEWDKQGLLATYQGYDRNLLKAIFIINPFSGGSFPITFNEVVAGQYYTECWRPSFSYDGRYVAYIRRQNSIAYPGEYVDRLYFVDLVNFDPENKPFGTEVPSANPTDINALGDPEYLPDGRIVYCSANMLDPYGFEGGDPNGIYVINQDGTDKSKVVDIFDLPYGAYLFNTVTVSPDGSQLAYVVAYTDLYSTDIWYYDIYIVNADGSNAPGDFICQYEASLSNMPNDMLVIRGLDFSPDGSKLIFSIVSGRTSLGGPAEGDLWTIDLTASEPQQITNDGNSFSPGWGTIDILGTNPPTVNFDYSISDATVQFTDESTDPDGVVAWCWDFGDGYRSSEQNPVHTYATSGTYSVTLIAMDNYGAADIKTKQVEITAIAGFFDTGHGTYPSISGTHIGTIIPDQDITVQKMYTYPCTGTGGHTEYVRIYGNEVNVSKTWNGYTGDYHNITFDSPFVLEAGKTYSYEIRTGSYPQIIHATNKTVTGGIITCTRFVDANGKEYTDWIPAIRLE